MNYVLYRGTDVLLGQTVTQESSSYQWPACNFRLTVAQKQFDHVIFIFLLYIIPRCVLLTGIITSYGVWLDGVLILNSSSSQRFLVVEELSPWSRHILRLQACTAQGCGKGPVVSEY